MPIVVEYLARVTHATLFDNYVVCMFLSGPYSYNRRESVTFSLTAEVWNEKGRPLRGLEVILSDVRKTENGWRAYSARFRRLEDQFDS